MPVTVRPKSIPFVDYPGISFFRFGYLWRHQTLTSMRGYPISLLCILVFLFACSSDDSSTNEPPSGDPDLNAADINVNIEDNSVILSDVITITLTENFPIDAIKVYIDGELVADLDKQPYQFNLDLEKYEDGDHILKIEVYVDDVKTASRTMTIKIDNNGPILVLEGIADGEVICSQTDLSPQINDEVSEIERVQILLDDEIILDTKTNEYAFAIKPEDFTAGIKNLKFIMEDVVGNISKDSISLGLAKKVLNVSFPANFIRQNVDKVHVILSDAEGNYLDSKTHSSGQEELIRLCSTLELEEETEFVLTFVNDFQDVVYGFYVYSNLNKSLTGDQIDLSPRSGGLSPAFPDLNIPFL